MPAPIKIRVGGELDPSLARSLASARDLIGRTEKAAQQDKKRTTSVTEQEAKRQLRAQQALTSAVESLDRQRARGLFASYRAQEAASERAAKAQERSAARAHAAERREIEKTARAIARAAAAETRERERNDRAAIRRSTRAGESFARRTSHRATRFMMPEAPLGSMVMRGLGGVARGMGVDFSLAGGVGRAVALQQRAAQISTSAYMNGAKGPSGTRANVGGLQEFFRQQAIANGFSSEVTSTGISEFVSRTGDLATSKASAGRLLKLAKATGADPNDVLSFAGTAAATTFKSPAASEAEAEQRAQYLEHISRIGAKSGKLGTVEFKDLAAYGPKLAASAQAFGGDPVKNMAEMFAAAQLGLEGGAASPAIATTAVASMTNTLKTPARRKQFKKAGVTIDDAANPGKLRAFSDIALESIQAAGANTEKFKKMWMNVQGARAVEGLRQTYLDAGGGRGSKEGDAAGLAAARARFTSLGGTLSDKNVDDDFAVNMDTAATKAQQFQERLDVVSGKLMQSLLPSLEQASPAIIKLAEGLGSLAAWVAENPWKSLFGAAAAVTLRAGVESLARAGIERMILGAGGGNAGTLGGILTGGAGGGRIGAGVQLLGKGLIGGAVGGLAGSWLGDQLGDTGMGTAIGAGAGAGLMMAGPMGAVAGATWGAAYDQNDKLKQQTGGKGILDLVYGSLTGEGGFFAQADDELNRQAKAEAAARAATEATGAGAGNPAMTQVVDQLTQQVDQGGQNAKALQRAAHSLEEIAAKGGVPGAPTGAGPTGRVSQFYGAY